MDELKITILPDGRLKVETDKVSETNHVAADSLMKFLASKFGSVEIENKAKHAHAHTHEHDKLKQ